MNTRRILLIDHAGLRALSWHKGIVHEEGYFAADDAGFAAFATYLQPLLNSLFYILGDVAEESFQFDKIPFVRGKDRAALIRRRRDQFFFGSPLSLDISMGRDSEGRRDERMLFAAFTRPSQFEPWLEILRAGEAQLVGVYSSSFIGQYLLEKGGIRRHLVLLTLSQSGLRQSHFENGQLQFSRLTPLNEADRFAEAIRITQAETGKIYQYLANHRLISRNTALPVLILAHPERAEIIKAHCPSTDNLQFELVDLHNVSKRIGLKSLPDDSLVDNLLVHLLVKHTPSTQFATEPERHHYRVWQWKRGLTISAFVLFFAAMLFSAHSLFNMWSLDAQSDTLRAQALSDKHSYDALVETLPKSSVTPDNLRALIARWDDLQRRSPSLDAALNDISQALTATPQIELSSLEWRLGAATTGNGTQNSAASGSADLLSVDIEALLPSSVLQSQRAQLTLIDNFAAALRSTPGTDVTILKQPFEMESGKSLKSGGETNASSTVSRFSLRYSVKVKP